MKKQHVKLGEKDKQYLESLIATGEPPVKVYRRALALLELDREKTYTAQNVNNQDASMYPYSKNVL